MTLRHTLELLLLAAIWGASFLFMRQAGPQFGPIPLMAIRTLIAALMLLPVLWLTQGKLPWRRHALAIAIVGLVNTAIPFCLFAYCTLYLDAGYTSVINACAPMFAAIFAFAWLGQRLSGLAVIGLIIGFSGVVLLVLSRHSVGEVVLLPVAAGLLATACYGLAVCMTQRYLSGVNSLLIATGSQLFSALFLAPFALLYWPATMPDSHAWLQVLVLGIFCTGLAYILYFRLIAHVGITNAVSVAYLVPVFGLLWGTVFLAEQLSMATLSGAFTILFGVALTSGKIRLPRTGRYTAK